MSEFPDLTADQLDALRRLDGRPLYRAALDALAYLRLDNADHILVVHAAATTGRLEGDPLWLLVIGASSGGKTEVIRALDDAADAHIDELSAAGLLSWGGSFAKGKAIGLLARIGDGPRLATIADLSSLLATSDRGYRDQLFSDLRRVYDGEFWREKGNMPAPLHWTGRLTLIAGVTHEIDNYTAVLDSLGPRWLFFRLPDSDIRQAKGAARANLGSQHRLRELRDRARETSARVVAEAAARADDIELDEQLIDTLVDIAYVACLGRAGVPRESYGARRVTGMANVEEPPRLTAELALLARGLIALDVPRPHVARICCKAALDSVPRARCRVLEYLADPKRIPLPVSEYARRCGLHRHVARFALEDLAVVGLTNYEPPADDRDGEKAGGFAICGDAADVVIAAFAAYRGWQQMCELHPSPPLDRGVPTSRATPRTDDA